MELERGVFLDVGSVGHEDLDLSTLRQCLPQWQLHEHTRPEACAARTAEAHVVISNKCVLDRQVLSNATSLKLVVSAATGTNHVDLEAARGFGIRVCNARDYATAAVTQHVQTLMLSLLSGLYRYRDLVRAGAWSESPHFCLLQHPIREARGLNLGIIGHGVLGQSVAAMGRKQGMNVLVAERRGAAVRPDHLPFDDVVAHADVISIHCPLDDSTRDLFDRRTLLRMKPSAILINTARGGIVNEQALAVVLREGHLTGAGVDVLTKEPPPPDHPLLADDIPGLLLTPHNAWASRSARQALILQLVAVIRAFERGQPINRVV